MKMIEGVEMITADEIGKMIECKNKSGVSHFIAKARLTAVPISKTRYYSKKAVRRYLEDGALEPRIVDMITKIIDMERNK